MSSGGVLRLFEVQKYTTACGRSRLRTWFTRRLPFSEVWCVYGRFGGLVRDERLIVCCPQSWSLAQTDKRASPQTHLLPGAITGSQDRFHYANRQLSPVSVYVCVCLKLSRCICVRSLWACVWVQAAMLLLVLVCICARTVCWIKDL